MEFWMTNKRLEQLDTLIIKIIEIKYSHEFSTYLMAF